MLIDVTGGSLNLFANTFASRTVTGLLFGGVAAYFVLPGFVATLSEWRDSSLSKTGKVRRSLEKS
jgi:hypothetical protein